MNILIDGESSGLLPADDRGFLYGETVFETIAFKDREAPLWDLHMRRMRQSAAWLDLPMPSAPQWWQDCQRLVTDHGRFVLRLTLSAGSGGIGYWPAARAKPRRIVIRRDWPARVPDQRESGLRLRLSTFSLPASDAGQGHKHGNRLLQVQAARECALSGHDEAVLLDGQGRMVEAISSNLLLVRNGRLQTHPRPAVNGVGLRWLKAQPEISITEEGLDQAALSECSEVLVINSVAGIRPVIEIDQHSLPIGPMCRRLQSLWDSRLI